MPIPELVTPELPTLASPETAPPVLMAEGLTITYGDTPVVRDVTLAIPDRAVTAVIGPSGCGKSSILQALNRMLEETPSATVEGRVSYRGQDIYDPGVDPVEVRRRIGMVSEQPTVFMQSIVDNVAFGPRVAGVRRGLRSRVRRSLERVGLWEEVRDRLRAPADTLSIGQQQRLCIARALAMDPDVILLDEPCASLDQIATFRIEDLLRRLVDDHAIVLVTHDLQQAARVSDHTAFIGLDDPDDLGSVGHLIEFADTWTVFSAPADPRTLAYVMARSPEQAPAS